MKNDAFTFDARKYMLVVLNLGEAVAELDYSPVDTMVGMAILLEQAINVLAAQAFDKELDYRDKVKKLFDSAALTGDDRGAMETTAFLEWVAAFARALGICLAFLNEEAISNKK